MATTVLITGGAGFLGSHTADALSARGWKIRIVDNLQSEVHAGRWPSYVRGKGYQLIRADVREKRTWERALRGADYVCHLAAYQDQRDDFSTFFTTNTVSTALLYECIAAGGLPVRRVLLASSQYIYGDGVYIGAGGERFEPEPRTLADLRAARFDIVDAQGRPARFVPFVEEQTPRPPNSYALSKYALELLAFRLGRTYGISTCAVRYSIMQGARQSPRNLYSGALRIFVSQALAGVPITVYEDGAQQRDFLNIGDAVRANLLLLRSRRAGFQAFNAGGGAPVTVLEFAEQVRRITGSSSPIAVGGFRPTDSRHAVSDISRLRALGWAPRRTIAHSIREYADWYRQEGFHRTVDARSLTASRLPVQAGARRGRRS